MTDLWISKMTWSSADRFGVPLIDIFRVYIWCYKSAVVMLLVAVVEAAEEIVIVVVVVVVSPSHVSVPRCTIATGLKSPGGEKRFAGKHQ